MTKRPLFVITFAKYPVFKHFVDVGKNGEPCTGGIESEIHLDLHLQQSFLCYNIFIPYQISNRSRKTDHGIASIRIQIYLCVSFV